LNWYAHAVLAERTSSDPACLLGAMLPDLAAASGLRVAPPAAGPLAQGLRLHALADAAFHAAPEFAALVAAGRGALEAAGLPRGSARAASHVGVELLLDGWLALQRSRSAAFHAALRAAARLADDAALFRPAPRPDRWLALCARLLGGELPAAFARPQRVALAVARALAARPRLALPEGAAAPLRDWLHAAQPEVAARGPVLLARAGAGASRAGAAAPLP
jgi:hypothetical protein